MALVNRVSKKWSQIERLFEKKTDRGPHRFFECFPWKDRNDEKEGESPWFIEEFCKPLKYTDLLRNESSQVMKKRRISECGKVLQRSMKSPYLDYQ